MIIGSVRMVSSAMRNLGARLSRATDLFAAAGLAVPQRSRGGGSDELMFTRPCEPLESRQYLTEVFLQGNFVEVGIHDSGSFGTSTAAPAGFHPRNSTASDRRLGFVADYGRDGWAAGTPNQTGDYFVPGTPEEGWSLRWASGTSTRAFNNYGLRGVFNIPQTSLTVTSSGDTRSAVWTGIATSGAESVRVTQTVLFNTNDLFFVMNIVLTNVGTTTVDNVRYMRNVDPDQEVGVGGSFTTRNYVAFQPPHPGINAAYPAGNTSQALVVAQGTSFGLTLGLGAIDPRATVSTEGFANRNPDDIINSPVAPLPTAPRQADEAIAIAFTLGALAPGQSTSFDYTYILNAADLSIALSRLGAVRILQPSGTVSGETVAFQATTADPANTTGMEFFVNDVSVGTSTTPDAFGVFGTTFNSRTLADGPATLRVVASFADGTTREKTASVTIDNAGPQVSFAQPTVGQRLSRSSIPIELRVDNPLRPPTRVSFFRQSVSTGTLFLGEDTTAPFTSSFSATNLPDGETVNITAVATDAAGRVTSITYSGTARRNEAPVASAGGPYLLDEGAALAVTAAGTTDIDGDILSFGWDINGDGVFTDATGISPTLTWAQLTTLGVAGRDGVQNISVRVNDGEGNTATAASTLTITRLADLVVQDVVVSPASSGAEVTVTWTIFNRGSASPAVDWSDRLTIARAGGATIVTQNIRYNISNSGPIAPGTVRGRSATFTLPDGNPGTGQFTANVTADIFNEVREWGGGVGETNNSSGNINFTSALAPYPDVAANTITVVGTPTFGAPLEVRWRVTNVGNAPLLRQVSDRIYLSRDGVLDGGDRLLLTVGAGANIPLAAGASYAAAAEVNLPLDINLAEGEYRILVASDALGQQFELIESNNTGASDPFAVVLPLLPDLVVTSISGPANALSGQQIPITWTVTNRGGGAATGRWRDEVLLSDDANIGGDTSYGGFEFIGTIPAGGSVTRTQLITLPLVLSGEKRIVVRTDRDNALYEHTNESNNITISTDVLNVTLRPFPNLTVSSVSAQAAAFSGQNVSIAWTVVNSGTAPTSVPQWTDRVYLSTDATLDGGDLSLGTANNPSYLNAGESYVNSLTATLPEGINGTYYFIVAADQGNAVFEYNREDDNWRAAASTAVTLTPPPDLRVTAITAPQNAFSGQSVRVGWSVSNAGIGSTRATSWADEVWISFNNDVLDAADRLGATVVRQGALNVNEGYDVTGVNVNLPVGISGDVFFIVRTDRGNQVFEAGFDGNNTLTRMPATRVNLTPPPDLEVTSVSAPAAIAAGRSFNVTYRVENNGSTPTLEGSWTDRFYLSTDRTLDASDRTLGTRTNSGALDIGDGRTLTQSFITDFTTVGTFYVIVTTDSADVVFEVDNVNNTGVSADASVIAVDAPDLRATGLTFSVGTGSGPFESGSSLTIDYSVTNAGIGATYGGSWTDTVILSIDSIVGNADDRTLGSFTRSAVLGAGQSYSRERVLLPLTNSIPAGSYKVFVSVDSGRTVFEGANDGNNVSAPLDVTIFRDTADLRVQAITVPGVIASGVDFQLTWVVSNINGARTRAGWWIDSVYLSSDTTLDSGDVALGDVLRTGDLDTNESYSRTASFRTNVDLAGTFFFIVNTDSSDRVAEGSLENNNIRAAGGVGGGGGGGTNGDDPIIVVQSPVADLAAVSILGPGQAESGRNALFTWAVRNIGNAAATGQWFDSVYLSTDQVFDATTDLYLGYSAKNGAVAPGETYENSGTFRIPQGVAGPYYVFINADSTSRVYERGLRINNSTYDSSVLTIELTPPADFVVGDIIVPSNGAAGQSATIRYTVRNEGANPAQGSWTDSIYISSDDRFDAGDPLFARVAVSGEVAAGGSYTRSVTSTLPGVLPGQYRVIIRSDIRNNIAESEEGNNVTAALDSVTMTIPSLEVNVTTAVSIAPGQAVYFRVAVDTDRLPLEAELLGAGSGSAQLYMSFGRVPTPANADSASAQPGANSQYVQVPSAAAGEYYILAMVPAGGVGGAFTIRARPIGFAVRALGVVSASDQGSTTIPVRGSLFDNETRFRLVRGSNVIEASSVLISDTANAFATFALTGAAAGGYSLEAYRRGAVAVSPTEVTLRSNRPGVLTATIDGPSRVRLGSRNQFTVSYGNAGDNDVRLPLVSVQSVSGAPFAISGGTPRAGILLLMVPPADGPSDILYPGAQRSVTLDVIANRRDMRFVVDTLRADDTTPIDVRAALSPLRPDDTSPAAWDAAVSRLIADVDSIAPGSGVTVGEFVTFITRQAEHARVGDRNAIDVTALLTRRIQGYLGLPVGYTSGQLLNNDTGLPAGNVRVVAFPRGGDGNAQVGNVQYAMTDAQGFFRFTNLVDGQYLVMPTGGEITAFTPITITAGTGPTDFTLRITTLPEFTGGGLYLDPDVRVTNADRNAGSLADFAYRNPVAGMNPPPGYRFITPTNPWSSFIEGNNGFEAWVLISNTDNRVVTAFRGTETSIPGLGRDAWADVGSLGTAQWRDNSGRVFNLVHQAADNIRAMNPTATIKYDATGHSLGGALAQYYTYDGIYNRVLDPSNTTLYSFNGLGAVAGIRQITGSYDSGRLSGLTSRHFAAEYDIVARLGDGHVGGRVALLESNASVGDSHSLDLMNDTLLLRDGATFEGAQYRLSTTYLQSTAGLLGNIGNFDRESDEAESILRLIAGLSLALANGTSSQALPYTLGEFQGVANLFAANLQARGFPERANQVRNLPTTIINGIYQSGYAETIGGVVGTFGLAALGAAITYDAVTDAASAAYNFVVDTATSIGNFLQEQITQAWDYITDVARQAWDDFSAAADRVRDYITDAFDAAYERVEQMYEEITNLAGEYSRAVVDGLTAIADDVSNWFERQVDGARDLARRTADWLDGLGDDIEDAWCNLFPSTCDDDDEDPDQDEYDPEVPVAVDPNDIIGPVGFGPERWVSPATALGYTIRFENDPEFATAPAQVVRITQTLDADLDVRTFRLGDFGFGELVVDVPDNRAFYQTRLDLRDSRGIYVDVVAGINITLREAFWTFTSIDPATEDLPLDPLVGFLPPNLTAPEGDGFVKYTVRAAAAAQTGAVIDAQARIIFDLQAPIDTPPIFNTIDSLKPTSSVEVLAGEVGRSFGVSWGGNDGPVGSALATYSVYVSVNGAAYELWLRETQLTSATYSGEWGTDYRFYAVAMDNAGNIEDAPAVADASTGTAPLPTVVSMNVNNGMQQRSMVTSVNLTFSAPVTLLDGAVTLSRRGMTPAPITLRFAPTGDASVWVVTFEGPDVTAASLADGVYDLAVRAERIAGALGQPLAAEFAAAFHRLFGDMDGDKDVDALDLNWLRRSLNTRVGDMGYAWWLDKDGDGDIDTVDGLAMRANLGVRLVY
jgi:hypothetical protein